MQFNNARAIFQRIPVMIRVTIIALGWLGLISALHFHINFESGQRQLVRMGYMPVVTNMAAPLLDYISREGDGVRFNALKFASFAEMAEALRNGDIEAAFIIAPLAIVLRQQGEDVKMVYIGNRHESTLVVHKDSSAKSIADLPGMTVAVPMRYSGHNLSIRELMKTHGLNGTINVVEMNPPDMPAALVSGDLDAYYVGEPFAAKTLQSGDARRMFFVEEVWPGFICNVMLVKQSFIENNPKLAHTLVQGAARSGLWVGRNPSAAAEIVATYWNQPMELVEYALSTPRDRVVFDRFIPQSEEIRHIADLMVRHGLAKTDEIDGLVEDRFAQSADLSDIGTIDTILLQGSK